jgi:hypothetical protein
MSPIVTTLAGGPSTPDGVEKESASRSRMTTADRFLASHAMLGFPGG